MPKRRGRPPGIPNPNGGRPPGSKNKNTPNAIDAAIAAAVIDGDSHLDIARKVLKLPTDTPSRSTMARRIGKKAVERMLSRPAWIRAMVRVMGVDKIAATAGAMLEAERSFQGKDGEIHTEPDWTARGRALEFYAKICGTFAPREAKVKVAGLVGVIEMPKKAPQALPPGTPQAAKLPGPPPSLPPAVTPDEPAQVIDVTPGPGDKSEP